MVPRAAIAVSRDLTASMASGVGVARILAAPPPRFFTPLRSAPTRCRTARRARSPRRSWLEPIAPRRARALRSVAGSLRRSARHPTRRGAGRGAECVERSNRPPRPRLAAAHVPIAHRVARSRSSPFGADYGRRGASRPHRVERWRR